MKTKMFFLLATIFAMVCIVNAEDKALVKKSHNIKCSSCSSCQNDSQAPAFLGDGKAFLLNDLPEGSLLRRSLESLSSIKREIALSKLSKIKIPVNDLDNLVTTPDGELVSVCKFKDQLPDAAPQANNDEAAANFKKWFIDRPVVSSENAAPQPETTGLGKTYYPEVNLDTVPEGSVPISSPPIRHSKPGSPNVLYIDFNGEVITGTQWNNYSPNPSHQTQINVLPYSLDDDYSTFNDAEQANIIKFWELVAEDYAPFDLDVTTERPTVWNRYKIHAMVTPTLDADGLSLPHSGSDGSASMNRFGQPIHSYDYNGACWSPAAWIKDYNAAPTYVRPAFGIAHECGHVFGMSHDGRTYEYYTGHDMTSSSSRKWAPIMGSSMWPDLATWSKGEYDGATRTEDDINMISSDCSAVGTGYRVDDHGNNNGSASALTIPDGINISDSGIIETTGETDVFAFTTDAGSITLNAIPHKSTTESQWGCNLDILLELYNSSGTLIASDNPLNDIEASITKTVSAGIYYLHVKPTGAGNPMNNPPNGYSVYASLGQYTVSGTIIGGIPSLPNIVTNTNSVTVPEGNSATFQVKLSSQPTATTSVNVARYSGDSDISVSGGASLSFTTSNWNSYQTVTLTASEDGDTTNGSATIRCSASGLSNKDIAAAESDNDTPAVGVLEFSSATYAVDEDGSSITIAVHRIGGSEGGVSVDYATSNNSATAGSDYAATSGTLNWSPGNSNPKSFTVSILDDSVYEGDETVTITLSNPSGITISGPNTATLTIIEDDINVDPPHSADTNSDWSISVSEVNSFIGLYHNNDNIIATANGDITSGRITMRETLRVIYLYNGGGAYKVEGGTVDGYDVDGAQSDSDSSAPPELEQGNTITVANSANSGAGSFRNAIANVAHGDTITFDASLEKIILVSEIVIDKSITIDGNGVSIVSGDAKTRIFRIYNEDEDLFVLLLNMGIVDGKNSADEFGGAIYNNGENLTLENCLFNRNSNNVAGGRGGAIYTSGSLTVNNCEFIDNSASEDNDIYSTNEEVVH